MYRYYCLTKTFRVVDPLYFVKKQPAWQPTAGHRARATT